MAEVYLKEGTRVLSDQTRSSERTWDVRLKYRYRVNGNDFSGDAMALRVAGRRLGMCAPWSRSPGAIDGRSVRSGVNAPVMAR